MSHHTRGGVIARAVAVTLLSLVVASCGVAQSQQAPAFTGVITDSMCSSGDHSGMGMGDTDAECAKACVASHGANIILRVTDRGYGLSDEAAAEEFIGRRVTITGTLDGSGNTIQIESIAPAD